jgi:TrmH family RNA methyltransferase
MRSVASRHNPLVGRFRALADSPDPAGLQLLLDGAHLVRDAQESGLDLQVVVVATSRLASPSEEGRLARALEASGVDVVEAPDAVLAAMSPVRSPSGLVAIAARPSATAAALCAPPSAFLLVAVDVQDPGNVGALARVGEAGGVTGLFACGTSASPFSWKAVRGSMGSVFRLPVVGGMPTGDVFGYLREGRVRAVAALPRGGADPDTVDWRGKIAIVLGGEGAGLPADVIDACQARVSVPMAARVESLNVAAAGAILVYAARRGRG